MIEQLTMFKEISKKETIKALTLNTLRSGWFSTTLLIKEVGAASADRRTRDLKKEGYTILERKRADNIIERHII